MPKQNQGGDDDVVGEGDISYDDGFEISSPGGAPSASTKNNREKNNKNYNNTQNNHNNAISLMSTTKKNGPMLPGVMIPEAALHPRVGLGGAPTAAASKSGGRNRDTLIVNRSVKGKLALQIKEYPCSRPKDFSTYYPPVIATYEKSYLNELAFAETSRKKNAEKRKEEAAKKAEADRQEKLNYATNGRGKKSHVNFGGNESSGGGGGETKTPAEALAEFFDRQTAAEKRRDEARTEASEAFEYQHNPDKKVCPICQGVQSFAEFKGNVKRCPRDACKGAHYRPKLLWTEVQADFLGRWSDFQVKRDQHLKATIKEIAPPFRVTHRIVFNKETNEIEKEEIPKLAWEEVADSFLVRQDEVVARLKEAHEKAVAERDRAVTKDNQPKMNKAYKFSKPLPDFWTRQMAAVERQKMTFEERLLAMTGQSS